MEKFAYSDYSYKSIQNITNDEIWKTIEDAPLYEISNLGIIRNKNTKRILKYYDYYGYARITLFTANKSNKTKKNFLVHRLLAEHFIENKNNYKIVNHIDGNRNNFNLNNLEWCTQKYNIYHSKNISKNGAIISKQRILKLHLNNPDATKEELIDILINNCR